MASVRLRRARWPEMAGESSSARCPEAGFSINSFTNAQIQAFFHGLLGLVVAPDLVELLA